MGAGVSEEEGGQERALCNERYLHWLLSEPSRVQEAFKPVWRACSTDEQGSAPKGTVLQVMLRVVAEFERCAEQEGAGGAATGAATSKTTRHLTRVVGMLPDRLTRAEALHLFRTALLAVQSALVMKSTEGTPLSEMRPPSVGGSAFGSGVTDGFSPVGGHFDTLSLEGPGAGSPVAVISASADASPSSRACSQAEDPYAERRPRHVRHPALRSVRLSRSGAVPSRDELEDENEELRALSEIVERSTREELAVVQALEEEVRASELGGSASRTIGGFELSDGSLLASLRAKAELTKEEVARLELEVRSREHELSECESEVACQQLEIKALLTRRGEEEASANTLSKGARDLTLELRSCRRTCGSLESEIASEEARAAALREAFEGRRARFTTAETAARNAELSTMRATRRRIAAEAAARREASAVEEAASSRSLNNADTASKMEALASEIAEVRSQGTRMHTAAGAKGRDRVAVTAQATAGAESALASLRGELAQAERDRDGEITAAHWSANEVAELEVVRARLEGQLAGRESELHAVHRRALRATPGAEAHAAGADAEVANAAEVEVAEMTAALQAVEARAAGARRRGLELQGELRTSLAVRLKLTGADSNTEEEIAVESAWQYAREVAAELGEAHAALARRQAQDQRGGPGISVVAALEATLKDAEAQEARSSAELAEARTRLAASLAKQHSLRRQASSVRGTRAGAAAPASAGRQRLETLRVKAAALEEESQLRGRALAATEARVHAAELAQASVVAGRHNGKVAVSPATAAVALPPPAAPLDPTLGGGRSRMRP